MSDVYSPVLGAALALSVGTFICALSALVSQSAHLGRLVQVGSLLSLAALVVAVASHVPLGHAPGSDSSLSPASFLAEHPMVIVVATASILLLLWARRRKRP